jgi:hypothetical protein
MKRILTIITILLACLTLGSQAAAESAYFGVRGELFFPVGLGAYSLSLPLFGIQGGYDFGPADESGFGIRASLTSLIVINRISLDALYTMRDSASGAGWYFGIGADALLLASSSTGVLFGAHLVAGYNFAISSTVAAFAEIWPGSFFNSGTLFGNSLLYISVASGFNFHL